MQRTQYSLNTVQKLYCSPHRTTGQYFTMGVDNVDVAVSVFPLVDHIWNLRPSSDVQHAHAEHTTVCSTPSALRLLLKLCDDFACEYDVAFNADKSKLLICRSFKQCKVVRDIKGRPFHIGGRDIEQVDSFYI